MKRRIVLSMLFVVCMSCIWITVASADQRDCPNMGNILGGDCNERNNEEVTDYHSISMEYQYGMVDASNRRKLCWKDFFSRR